VLHNNLHDTVDVAITDAKAAFTLHTFIGDWHVSARLHLPFKEHTNLHSLNQCRYPQPQNWVLMHTLAVQISSPTFPPSIIAAQQPTKISTLYCQLAKQQLVITRLAIFWQS
jgi:hypothetical protein